MKIVFVINSLGKGGAEHVAVNLAEHFASIGYEVRILTAGYLHEEYKISSKIKRIDLDYEGSSHDKGRIGNIFTRMTLIRKQIKEFRPDVMVSFIGKINFYSILASRGLRIPTFVSVRSDPNREYATLPMRVMANILYTFSAGIILQTEDAKLFFSKRLQKKVTILPNSVHPAFIRERFCGERKQEIVSVGRLDANKNHKILVQAFAAIAKEYPELQLVFYGDGYPGSDTTPLLKEMAENFSISDRVHFMGMQTKVADLTYQSRIFVLTSNVEGMPNALIEAMSLGLAVISTDCPCGGPKTVIQDGENGLLIPVDDSVALEAALRKILTNKELEEKLGTNANKLGKELKPENVNRMWQQLIESSL